MQHSAEMARCLRDGDVTGLRRLWAHVAPNMPQPKTDREATIQMHMARTQYDKLHLKLRAYSHRWLLDNGYPSLLPDKLKPKAEQIFPNISDVVGIACGGKSEISRAIAPFVRGAMSEAVLECYADNKKEPKFVKSRMMEAKDKTIKKLIGRLVLPS